MKLPPPPTFWELPVPSDVEKDVHSPALGWTLGPYRIAREIGRGQFGTVYEALDPQGQPVALKLIPLHGTDSDDKLAAERQGADLQQRFSLAAHQLVPAVLDHQRIDPYYAIAMELVSGPSLTALIKAGPMRDDRAATIAASIAEFLVAAHAFTIGTDENSRTILVHGDLKPAHIMILADGSIRVLDFGIAKALAASKTATTNLWSSVDYASPERLESGRVNEHADFWSLGVMLFEMVAGVRPYYQYEHNRSRLERAIRTQEPRASLPATVDPRLAAIIGKLLAPQLENRYQSARQIAGDLHALLDGTPVVAFIEASRADQATVRIPVATHRDRTNWNQPTEPLPRPVSAAPVEPAPAPTPPASPTLPAEPAIAAVSIPPAPRAPHVPAARRRYAPWIAAALSLLAPGLGQIYNREYLRALVWLIITPGFWIGSAGLLGWPFHLIAAYTAYRRAASGSHSPPVSLPAPAGSQPACAGP